MILYSKFNPERKKCFQLITKIKKVNNIIISSKSSSNKKSQEFLNTFYDKYNLLVKKKSNFTPIKPQKISATEISFEYQKLPTLEYLLFLCLKAKDQEKFITLLFTYIDLLKKNKIKTEFVTPKFKKIFGTFGTKNKMECIQFGCLDLNFDNIIVDESKNKYKLIDYEWTFDKMPIPYKYLFFRAITVFFANFSNYNPNSFFPLEEIFKLVKITPKEQKIFINFEYNFQYYVYGNKFKKNIKTKEFYNNFLYQKNNLNQNNFFTNTLSQISNFQIENKNQIDQINKEKEKLMQDLNKIQSSKTYKLWQKYNQIKKMILNKKN